jgi:hypothetical protein
MIRKLKLIYILPVLILLLGGAACGGYFGLISPQMQKTEASRANWMAKRAAWKQEEPKYEPALNERVEYAQKLYDGYTQFHRIQNAMPEVYNLKSMYPDEDKKSPRSKRKGLIRWYNIMVKGQLANEVNRWIRRFHLAKPPVVKFDPDKPMGYEETLPDKKVVTVDLGSQVYEGRGINDLCTKVAKSIGYSYFPLIVSLPGDSIALKVHRNDRRHSVKLPLVSMDYSATAFFMTRGWDPKESTAAKDRDEAKAILLHKPIEDKKTFTEPELTCPPLLWMIKADYETASKATPAAGGGAAPPDSGAAPATGAP